MEFELAPPNAARDKGRYSFEAITAVCAGALLLVVLLGDAYLLGHAKHAICDRWLVKKNLPDCAGGDGFREWGPHLMGEAAILLVAEAILVPLVVYAGARLLKRAMDSRRTAAPSQARHAAP